MARLRFEIKGDPDSVSLETYSQATHQVIGILRELDTAISRRSSGTLNWYISRLHNNGTLLLEVLSKQRQLKRQMAGAADVSTEVATSLVTGAENNDAHGASPPRPTCPGMPKGHGEVSLIPKNSAKGFVASVPEVQ